MEEFNEAASVDLKEAKHRFSRLGLGAFVILVLASVVQIAAFAIINFAVGDGETPSWVLWAVTFVPLYCIAVPVGLLIMRKVPASPAEPRSFGTGRFLKLVPICIFLMYAGNLVGTIVTSLLGSLKGGEVVNPLENYAMDDSILLKILVIAILAPLIEEYIFRKTLIDRMRPYGEKLAVVTSALMFGLFHGNLSQFFYAFALGALFGYVYVRTGRLRYSAALHIFVNTIGSVVAPALLENAGLDKLGELDTAELLSDPEALQALVTPGLLIFMFYALLLVIFAILGLILFCINVGRAEFVPTELELPKEARFKTVWCNAGMILLVLACIATIVQSVLA